MLSGERVIEMSCIHIRGDHVLPGWGCCKCKCYNGYQRDTCKNCGHGHCYDTTSDLGDEAVELKITGNNPEVVKHWLAQSRRAANNRLPESGDNVFFCLHMLEGDAYHSQPSSHWYRINLRLHGLGGTDVMAKWYNCCSQCHQIAKKNPHDLFRKVPLGGHIVWAEAKPVSRERVS